MISVIIVNYNGGRVLHDAVRAVLNSTVSVEVIVVDNGSTDGSANDIEARYHDDTRVQILRNSLNRGFAVASNLGLRAARGHWLLLLNPDCIVRKDTLSRVVDVMQKHPDVAVAGCMIQNPDGSEQAGARRAVPTPWRSFVRVLHLDKVFPGHPRFRTFLLNREPLPVDPTEVEAISGAFMLARREAVDQIGMLDETYFLHCEDLDWCMRFRRAGWKILFVPDAVATHYKGTCSRNRPVFVYWHMHRGMAIFYKKFFRSQYPLPMMAAVIGALIVRLAVLASRSLAGQVVNHIFGEPVNRRDLSAVPTIEGGSDDPALISDCGEKRAGGSHPDQPAFSWSGRDVLVTGGTGYIGRHLVSELARKGAYLRLLMRKPPVQPPDVGVIGGYQVCHPGDLEHPASLAGICQGIDTVFHLAGFAHAEAKPRPIEQTEHWRISVEGTRAMLREASASGVRRFVFVSTVKVMGEGEDGCLDENSPLAPTSVYGIAKCEAERLVLEAGNNGAMEIAVLRLPMVYGGENPGNLVRMVASIDRGRFPPLPDVPNRRSMVHVEDVVQALLLAAAHDRARGRVYLVTDGRTYSAWQLYELICVALGKQLPRRTIPLWLLRGMARVGDLLKTIHLHAQFNSEMLQKLIGSAWYSDARIRRELGYVSRHTLPTAMPQIIATYRAAQSIQTASQGIARGGSAE